MLKIEEFELSNGLKVYVHEDHSSPTAVLDIMYNVGARDEEENKTGFAHLFEHLMFGGSVNVKEYDTELQKVGGDNNAFTSNDVTNYYVNIPSTNLETAFWLESDRMLGLSFDPNVLEVQRKVVIEEFKQRYLNQPYGDIWFHLREMAYKIHPYNWPTIGREISHIEKATMEDVKSFFYNHYTPNNAVMVVAGDVMVEQVKELAKKWFEPIGSTSSYKRNLPEEKVQTEARHKEVEADVPVNAIYKAFHMKGRMDEEYIPADLLGDIIGRGKSSRLHKKLVEELRFFSSIGAFSLGSFDPGLLVISGRLNEGVSLEEADKAIEEVIYDIQDSISEQELEKVKNQAVSTLYFGQVELLERATAIAYAATLGDVNFVNTEEEKIEDVTLKDVKQAATKVLIPTNCSTLYYKAKQA